jgi:NAD-dependent histone deacetylase SIR2
VDGLEIKAGVSREKIVFAHGNRNEANCVVCKSKVPAEEIMKSIKTGHVYYCEKCRGPCKFSVVFFGESMPQEFFSRRSVLKFNIGTL